jgi:hypothetical protein
MITTQYGVEVRIQSVLETDSHGNPHLIKVGPIRPPFKDRSKSWIRRVSDLQADGGIQEILEAINRAVMELQVKLER